MMTATKSCKLINTKLKLRGPHPNLDSSPSLICSRLVNIHSLGMRQYSLFNCTENGPAWKWTCLQERETGWSWQNESRWEKVAGPGWGQYWVSLSFSVPLINLHDFVGGIIPLFPVTIRSEDFIPAFNANLNAGAWALFTSLDFFLLIGVKILQ